MRTKKTTTGTAKSKQRRRIPASAAPESPPSNQPAHAEGKLSALSAAARVLEETGQAMNCRQLIEAMAAHGYWTSPGGRTPEATLATAVTMLPKVA